MKALIGIFFVLALGCHNTRSDPFMGTTVDCTKVGLDSVATPEAKGCLDKAETEKPLVCLTKIVTTKMATVEEVACAVIWIAQKENVKVEAGTPADIKIRNFAIEFIVQERISILNSYEGE